MPDLITPPIVGTKIIVFGKKYEVDGLKMCDSRTSGPHWKNIKVRFYRLVGSRGGVIECSYNESSGLFRIVSRKYSTTSRGVWRVSPRTGRFYKGSEL